MMSQKSIRQLLKYILFTLIFFIFCAFQTSFWAILIDFLPAPQLWLIFLVYIFLKWPSFSTVFYAYFLGYILTFYSSMPLRMSWMSILGVSVFVWVFKNRIHSTSLFLFSVLCGACSLFYSGFYIFLSWAIENNVTSILFFERLLQAGVTFLVSSSVYYLLMRIDNYFLTNEAWSNDFPSNHSQIGDL